MKPLQISPETALKLSKSLNLPLEQIMHMPTPVLLKKLAEAEAKEKAIQNSCRNLQLLLCVLICVRNDLTGNTIPYTLLPAPSL